MFGLFPETPRYRGPSQPSAGSTGAGGIGGILRVFGDSTPAYRGAASKPAAQGGWACFACTPAYRTAEASPPAEPPADGTPTPEPEPSGDGADEPPDDDADDPMGEHECAPPIVLDRGAAIRTRVPVTIVIHPDE